MSRNLRGLYAVLVALSLSASTAVASSTSATGAPKRSWAFAGALTDLLARVFDRGGDGPDIDPSGLGGGEAGPSGEPSDHLEGDDGPDADPAG